MRRVKPWLAWLGAAALATAAAAEEKRGVGTLDGRDVHAGTVVIDSVEYRVGPGTVLEGPDGEPVSLLDLPLAGQGAGDFLYEYHAVSTPGGMQLQHLRASEMAD